MIGLLTWALLGLWVVTAVWAAGHALLNKRDPRAALGWITVSLAVPLIGALLYFFFGINRIRMRARALPGLENPRLRRQSTDPADTGLPLEFSELAGISNAVSRFDLVCGNSIEVLHNGKHGSAQSPAQFRDGR